MPNINNFSGFKQILFSNFINDNITSSTSSISTSNIFTIGSSTTATLPLSDFNNVLPGAIIIANNLTRFVLSKIIETNSVILNSEVNWDNLGHGYSFTYNNPIAQVLGEDLTLLGYLTSERQLYLLDMSTYTSPTDELKLLNSEGDGLYINSDGDVFKGNTNSDIWIKLGTIIDGGSW